MKLVNEQSFDFKKNYEKEQYKKQKITFKAIYIFIGICFTLSMFAFINYFFPTNNEIKNQYIQQINNDYIKNVSEKWDLIYNGQTSSVDDYVKLGKAIKSKDEDSILMYYTLLKARTDISTLSYMSNFDVEVFSTHSLKIGNKIKLNPKDNDSNAKTYKFSENLVEKMKKVYLSRTYPDKLALNHNCDDKIQFCNYSKQASNINADDNITQYAHNQQKIKDLLK